MDGPERGALESHVVQPGDDVPVALAAPRAPASVENAPDIPVKAAARALAIAATEGRNAGLLHMAVQLRDNHFDEASAFSLIVGLYLARLWTTNRKGEHAPYTEREVDQVCRSVFAREKRDPWEKAYHPTDRTDRTDPSDDKAKAPPAPPPPAPSIFLSAPELMARTVPPRRFAAVPILPEGLAIFAGKTKTGKSWVALALAVAVACGGKLFGRFDTPPGDVLYLALEDNEESLQERLGLLLQGMPAPDRLTFALEWKRTNQGGLDLLEAWLTEHPDSARLIIVDVLAKIRPRAKGGNGNGYEEDYDVCDALKRLSDRFRVSILLIHHLRKMPSEDPVDQILGSVGMSGSPDTAWVWRRARKETKGTLFVTGRRIKEETEHVLEWDPLTVSFADLGDSDLFARTKEQDEILEILRSEAPREVRLKEIATLLGKNPGTVRKLADRLKSEGKLVSGSWGTYRLPEGLDL
jgi:hypothetical protein